MLLYITPWERAALQQLADGRPPHAIAERVGANDNDLEASLTALFSKIGAASKADALALAVRRGLVTLGN